MASIVQNILGDQALQLANEEFVRPLPWGNSWNYLRVGLYFRFFGQTTITDPAYLQIGVCSGMTNTFGSNNCTGYAGSLPGNVGGGGLTLTYDSANKRYQTGSNYFTSQCSKIGATASYGLSAGFTGIQYFAAATTPSPGILMCDFTRPAAGQVAPTCTYQSSAQFGTGNRFYDFMRSMEDQTYGNSFVTAGNALTLTGLPAVMDTLSIWWNHNIPVVEIHAICAVVFY